MTDAAWSQTANMAQTETAYVRNMATLKCAGRYDIPVLLSALTDPSACQGMTPVQERTYLNEVMNTLGRMDDPKMGFENALIRLAGETDRDSGVREYALQHLGLNFKKSRQKEAILFALNRYATSDDIFATALLQLHRLGRMGVANIDKGSFRDMLVGAVKKQQLRISDQITLLSLIEAYKAVEALPEVRSWLMESSVPAVVRGSTDVLLRYGDQKDRDYIQEHVLNIQKEDHQDQRDSSPGRE